MNVAKKKSSSGSEVRKGGRAVTGLLIAFIIAMAVCFSLTLIDKMLFFLPRPLLGFLGYLGADFHFQNISKGIIDSRDILYFLSVSFLGLYGAHLSLEAKN